MKSHRTHLLLSLCLVAVAPQAWASNEKEVVIRRRIEGDAPRHIVIKKEEDGGEKEKVTYLGIETAPAGRTLGAQLGLPRDVGLVVTQVMEKSPAADLLKEDDVLTKFDDQMLVNMQQLGVLVRARKDGEEVKLTVVRGGKETTVKVKLGTREVSKRGNAFFFRSGGPGEMSWSGSSPGEEDLPGLERLGELPGMGPEHARDVLRMIGRERGNVMTGPRMHIIARAGTGSTILDLPKSNISYSDDEGSVEIKVEDGHRTLTVADARGTVSFQGPIDSVEERKKLPPGVMKRLEKLDAETFEFEAGDDFRPEVVPLPPEPAKTKISHSPEGKAGPSRQSF